MIGGRAMEKTTIREYAVDDYDRVMAFLERVTTLSHIEEELFENSILIERDGRIVGMISYENFRGRALIRYFIFDKDVQEEEIVTMYGRFFQKLKERGIRQIFVIISKDIVAELFSDLGFVEFNKDEFFLTEQNIYETKYRDSMVMCYTIET